MLCARFSCNWPGTIGSVEEVFLNLVNAFSLFSYYFDLEKDMALHLNKLETPSRKDDLSQCYNWPSGSEEVENVKRLQIDRQADGKTPVDQKTKQHSRRTLQYAY